MNPETVVVSAISGVAASIVGTPVAHWLATRRHVTERWWELKAEAYSDLLRRVAQVRTALSDLHDELGNGTEDSDEQARARAMHLWESSSSELALIANQGAFKISHGAEQILGGMQATVQEPPPSESFREWMVNTGRSIGRLTYELAAEARRDLRVR
jgi:hypothetical protein